MKGNISLKSFIHQVSKELKDSQTTNPEKAFYELTGVSLEVSFSLDTTAKGEGRFVVVSLGAEAKETQVHKVTLQLAPIKKGDAFLGPSGPMFDSGTVFSQSEPFPKSDPLTGPTRGGSSSPLDQR